LVLSNAAGLVGFSIALTIVLTVLLLVYLYVKKSP
jgi:hypothetical protein